MFFRKYEGLILKWHYLGESMPDNEPYELIEKMIDIQIGNAHDMSELKKSISNLENSDKKLDEIQSYFANGFRSEIKEHITQEVASLSRISKDVDEIKQTLTKPWFWIKLIGAITSGLIAVILIVGQIILKLMQ